MQMRGTSSLSAGPGFVLLTAARSRIYGGLLLSALFLVRGEFLGAHVWTHGVIGMLDFCRDPRVAPRNGVEDTPLLSVVEDLVAFAAIRRRNWSLFMSDSNVIGNCSVSVWAMAMVIPPMACVLIFVAK